MSRSWEDDSSASHAQSAETYVFTRNDPYDRSAAIEPVIPRLMASGEYMSRIRGYQPPADGLALWYLGQNGFILKGPCGPLIGIDLYLTNHCASRFAHLPFRLDRQLPVFIEPEDLDIDVFITTHSHDDHADPQTLLRMPKQHTQFIGPFDSIGVYRECGVPDSSLRMVHPGETLDLGEGTSIQSTFALPTDATDLNHTGVLCRLANGLTFYNTGDTAHAAVLGTLLPVGVDVCAICINGGFHNLAPAEAAAIISQIRPRVVVPCHYDMMVNNVGSPEMFRVALDRLGSASTLKVMRYYEPWLYQRS
jgi:L-ascorbate 6-phosphate lactonase